MAREDNSKNKERKTQLYIIRHWIVIISIFIDTSLFTRIMYHAQNLVLYNNHRTYRDRADVKR